MQTDFISKNFNSYDTNNGTLKRPACNYCNHFAKCVFFRTIACALRLANVARYILCVCFYGYGAGDVQCNTSEAWLKWNAHVHIHYLMPSVRKILLSLFTWKLNAIKWIHLNTFNGFYPNLPTWRIIESRCRFSKLILANDKH